MTTLELNLPIWGIEEMIGYKPKTTFYDDFSIAERYSVEAIKDTYDRAFNEWKDNIVFITELAMVLNHKCWAHYENGDTRLSKLYSTLYYKVINWADENLTGDNAAYFFRTLD